MLKPQISPKLYELSQKGKDGKEVKLQLSDGRKISCCFEMLTYANTSDEDDTDIMVALVKYKNGGELLAEEDIKQIF